MLQTVEDSVREHLLSVREQLESSVLRYGLESMPDELLLRVIELSVEDSFRMATSVSHVCRHFRSLALRLPTIWTLVSATQNADELKTWLERSRNAPLSITVDCPLSLRKGPRDPTVCNWQSLVPHACRWRDVSLETSSKCPQVSKRVMQRLNSFTRDLYLPQLEELSLSHCKSDHAWLPLNVRDEALDWKFNTESPVCLRWRMPSLRRLTLCSVIPFFSFGESLVVCNLFLDGLDRRDSWNLDRLSKFFALVPSLQELSMTMEDAYSYPVVGMFARVTLPSLTALSLHVRGHRYSNRGERPTFQGVLQGLHLPRLARMTLSLIDTHQADGEALTDCLFPSHNTYHSLVSLHLEVEMDLKSALLVPTGRFPQLYHLSIRTVCTNESIRFAGDGVPPLRSIRLQGCGRRLSSDALGLLRPLIEREEWNDFEKFESVGGRTLFKSDIEAKLCRKSGI